MASREAACSCGQLRLTAEGDPIRISMCHCLACQRRTGSAFGIQARFPANRVQMAGRFSDFVRISDEGEQRTFHFCPDCGGDGLLHACDRSRCHCRSDRRFCRAVFPAADGLGVRVAAASLAGHDCRDGALRLDGGRPAWGRPPVSF